VDGRIVREDVTSNLEASEVTAATMATVMQSLLRRGVSTRAEIVNDTGLSRPTVSRTLATLLRDGTIEQVKDPNHVGRGRPVHLVGISSRRANTVGVELGRRHIAFAVADLSGRVVFSATRDTNAALSLLDRAREALAFMIAQTEDAGVDLTRLRNVVVGTPGPRYRNPENHKTSDVSLARLSRERTLVAKVFTTSLRAPVSVGNNTRYTALAEIGRRRAAGLSVDNLIYLRVDEGVGGGIVAGGELQTGAWDAAGEMGHISLDLNGAPCFCGGRGCLELVAALPAVILAAGAADLDDLRDLATRDPAAATAIHDAATATAQAIAGVLAVANPSVLVIGGSVASLPGFMDRFETVTRATAPLWATLDLVIEAAATDHLLGAIGAAAAGHGVVEGSTPFAGEHVTPSIKESQKTTAQKTTAGSPVGRR